MLEASEEHRKLFKDQPLLVFRRTQNLKDSLVRERLPNLQTEVVVKKN